MRYTVAVTINGQRAGTTTLDVEPGTTAADAVEFARSRLELEAIPTIPLCPTCEGAGMVNVGMRGRTIKRDYCPTCRGTGMARQ